MRRRLVPLMITTSIIMNSFSTLAGQWIQIAQDWSYLTDDGNLAKDTWLWLDEDRDGQADLYHFDVNGVMSKDTCVSLYSDSYWDYFMIIDEYGKATENIEEGAHSYQRYSTEIGSVNIPPYLISVQKDNNGDHYVYSLKEDIDHYRFKEIHYAWIDTPLIDCGDHYFPNVKLEVCPIPNYGGHLEVMECYIPAIAYFSKECKVLTYDTDNIYCDKTIPITLYLASYELNHCFITVKSTDSNGYITSCVIWPWGWDGP